MQKQWKTAIKQSGGITFPIEIRRILNMKPGLRVVLTIDRTRIMVQTITPELVDEVCGMFRNKKSSSAALGGRGRKSWRD